MTTTESLRLLMANLAIAGFLLMGSALGVAFCFRSLPKQHAALMVGILASLIAPLLVVLAWVFGLGQLPELTWSQQKNSVTNQSPIQNTVVSSRTTSAPSVDATVAMLPAASNTPAAVTTMAAVAQSVEATPVIAQRSAAGSMQVASSDSQIPAAINWFARTNAHLANALLLTWVIGSAALCLLQVRNFFRCQRMLKRCRPVQSAIVRQTLLEAAQRVGIQGEIRLLAACGLPAPAVVGITTPAVLIPEDAETQFTPSHLFGALVHELSHIARKDHWMMGFTNGAFVLYWWNPLLYLMMRRISETREMICDDIASAASGTADEYAATIVGVAERAVHQAGMIASLGMGKSSSTELERRLKRVLSRGNRAAEVCLSPLAKCGMALFVVVLCGAVLFAQVPAVEYRIVSGRVIAEDGSGVKDAIVVLPLSFNGLSNTVETQTDGEGTFELKIPTRLLSSPEVAFFLKDYPEELWKVWAFAKEHCLGTTRAYAQIVGDSSDSIVIRLPQMEEHRVKIASPNGEPIVDAEITSIVYRSDSYYPVVPERLLSNLAVRTDAEGHAILRGVQLKDLSNFRVKTRLYGTQMIWPHRENWLTTKHNPNKALLIQLREVASIQGKVVGPAAYLGGVTIRVTTCSQERGLNNPFGYQCNGYAEVKSDREGNFTIPAIAGGGKVDAFATVDHALPVLPKQIESTFIIPGQALQLEVQLSPTVKVQGLVRDKTTKLPIANAYIRVTHDGITPTARSDQEGRFEIRKVMPGSVSIRCVSPKEYAANPIVVTRSITVDPKTGDIQLATFELEKVSNENSPEKEPTVFREVKGKLVNRKGVPLANKILSPSYKYHISGTDRTAADGTFVLSISTDNPVPDVITILNNEQLPAIAKTIQQDPFVVCSTADEDYEKAEADRHSKNDVTLVGRVLFENKPASQVRLSLFRAVAYGVQHSIASHIGEFETNADGTYRLTGLKPGDHYRIAIHPNFPAAAPSWNRLQYFTTIPNDAQGDIDLPNAELVGLTQSLSGTVVDNHGKPVTGALVRVKYGDGDAYYPGSDSFASRTQSDANGKFELTGLPNIHLQLAADYDPKNPNEYILYSPSSLKAEKNQKDVRLVLEPSLFKSTERTYVRP